MSQQNKTEFERRQKQLDAELAKTVQSDRDAAQREHLVELRNMGVDLTEFLTQGRADQVVELRGEHSERAQFHLGNQGNNNGKGPRKSAV